MQRYLNPGQYQALLAHQHGVRAIRYLRNHAVLLEDALAQLDTIGQRPAITERLEPWLIKNETLNGQPFRLQGTRTPAPRAIAQPVPPPPKPEPKTRWLARTRAGDTHRRAAITELRRLNEPEP